MDTCKIRNCGGMEVELHPQGARVVSILVPCGLDKVDVCLGFSSIETYTSTRVNGYFGATMGRVSGWINNSSFDLNGTHHRLERNINGRNHLHGGPTGFFTKLWKSNVGQDDATFMYLSKSGENGYPGNVEAAVTYAVCNDNSLVIEYSAVSDEDTPINMSNHIYFNLNGTGSALYHELQVEAERYLPVDSYNMVTGEIASVEGRSIDFRKSKMVGQDIDSPELLRPQLDCYFCCNGEGLRRVATLQGDKLKMDVHTTALGFQLYVPQMKAPKIGKNNVIYDGYPGISIQTQNYPDAVNHPHFPSIILEKGKEYRAITKYTFSEL